MRFPKSFVCVMPFVTDIQLSNNWCQISVFLPTNLKCSTVLLASTFQGPRPSPCDNRGAQFTLSLAASQWRTRPYITGFPVTLEIRENLENEIPCFQSGKPQGICKKKNYKKKSGKTRGV